MPRFDGTGPRGQGAKTGRGIGLCDDEGRMYEIITTADGFKALKFIRKGNLKSDEIDEKLEEIETKDLKIKKIKINKNKK